MTSLFKPKVPKIEYPAPATAAPPPKPAPVVDDAASQRYMRQEAAALSARQGRASTILSDADTRETLGA